MSAITSALTGDPTLVAQVGRETASSPSLDPTVSFFVSVAIYLVVGGLLLAFGRPTVDATVEYARRRPLYATVVGVGAQIAAAVIGFLLAVTVVGLLVAVPGAIVFALVGIVGTTCAVIAVGSVVADLIDSEGRAVDLALGAVLASAVGLVPILGGLVNFVVGALGLGALLLVYFTDPEERFESNAGQDRHRDESPRSRDRGGHTDRWSRGRR